MNGNKISLSEGVFKLVFENSGMAITVADDQERLILWNRSAEQLLEMDPAQLYLKPVRELYPNSEWERLRLENIRKTGRVFQTETKVVNSWNKTVDIDLSLSLLKNSEGAVQGSIAMFKDISERKKAEQAFKKVENFINLIRRFTRETKRPKIIAELEEKINQISL